MSLTIGWQEIALRLFLTVLAGVLVGLNRSRHGHPAGLRTTLLVCVAASVSMIQTNLLLATAGRPAGSFIQMDLMRLPLGILSGMGFIGGGVILKRDSLVVGVTTAATLWYVTVLGLCFGGGQHLLGLTALGIGLVVLWTLKEVERKLPHERMFALNLVIDPQGPAESEIRRKLLAENFRLRSLGVNYDAAEKRLELAYDLSYFKAMHDAETPQLFNEFIQTPGISHVQWKSDGVSNEQF